MEPVLKQINYDTFTVDFLEINNFTHLHFYGTEKEHVLDSHIRKNFPFSIKETGKEIEEEILKFAPEISYLSYDKKTLLESRDKNGSLKSMSDRDNEVQEEYKRLELKYKDRSVIHKAITEKILQGRLKQKVITYMIPEINPFIDTIMLKMAEEIEKDLEKSK